MNSLIIVSMIIRKCDLCNKTIKGKPIVVGRYFGSVELCDKCSQPIVEFLTNNKLLEKAGLKDLKSVS